MIQVMLMCHGGFMGTLHANSLNRLETMVLMNQIELPLHALWAQIPLAIDVGLSAFGYEGDCGLNKRL